MALPCNCIEEKPEFRSQNGNDGFMSRVTARGITTRRISGERVPDTEPDFNKQWLENHFDRLVRAFAGLTRYLEDKRRPVDEYQPVPNATETEGTVTVQAQFDRISARIISVLAWGPPNSTGTLTLGDCVIPVTIPASGVLPIGPLGLLLDHTDTRSLTLNQTTGNMGLRLMGWADERY